MAEPGSESSTKGKQVEALPSDWMLNDEAKAEQAAQRDADAAAACSSLYGNSLMNDFGTGDPLGQALSADLYATLCSINTASTGPGLLTGAGNAELQQNLPISGTSEGGGYFTTQPFEGLNTAPAALSEMSVSGPEIWLSQVAAAEDQQAARMAAYGRPGAHAIRTDGDEFRVDHMSRAPAADHGISDYLGWSDRPEGLEGMVGNQGLYIAFDDQGEPSVDFDGVPTMKDWKDSYGEGLNKIPEANREEILDRAIYHNVLDMMNKAEAGAIRQMGDKEGAAATVDRLLTLRGELDDATRRAEDAQLRQDAPCRADDDDHETVDGTQARLQALEQERAELYRQFPILAEADRADHSIFNLFQADLLTSFKNDPSARDTYMEEKGNEAIAGAEATRQNVLRNHLDPRGNRVVVEDTLKQLDFDPDSDEYKQTMQKLGDAEHWDTVSSVYKTGAVVGASVAAPMLGGARAVAGAAMLGTADSAANLNEVLVQRHAGDAGLGSADAQIESYSDTSMDEILFAVDLVTLGIDLGSAARLGRMAGGGVDASRMGDLPGMPRVDTPGAGSVRQDTASRLREARDAGEHQGRRINYGVGEAGDKTLQGQPGSVLYDENGVLNYHVDPAATPFQRLEEQHKVLEAYNGKNAAEWDQLKGLSDEGYQGATDAQKLDMQRAMAQIEVDSKGSLIQRLGDELALVDDPAEAARLEGHLAELAGSRRDMQKRLDAIQDGTAKGEDWFKEAPFVHATQAERKNMLATKYPNPEQRLDYLDGLEKRLLGQGEEVSEQELLDVGYEMVNGLVVRPAGMTDVLPGVRTGADGFVLSKRAGKEIGHAAGKGSKLDTWKAGAAPLNPAKTVDSRLHSDNALRRLGQTDDKQLTVADVLAARDQARTDKISNLMDEDQIKELKTLQSTPNPDAEQLARLEELSDQKKALSDAQARMVAASEVIGDEGAAAMMEARGAKLVHSGNGNGTFDQVWMIDHGPDKDPEVFFVEAKGGGASNSSTRTLKDGTVAQQGSSKYHADLWGESKDSMELEIGDEMASLEAELEAIESIALSARSKGQIQSAKAAQERLEFLGIAYDRIEDVVGKGRHNYVVGHQRIDGDALGSADLSHFEDR